MKAKKDYTLLLMLIIFIIAALCSCGNGKQPVNVEYFKQGQILLPDYACTDTLIVIDAEGLNKSFAPIEQGIEGNDYGDYQYDSLFHTYCKVK